LRPFGLGDDAPFAAPAVACRPGKVLEAARRLAGLPALKRCRSQFLADRRDKTAVSGKAEDVVHTALFAPGHQRVARKARIGAQHDANIRPALTNLGDDTGHFLQRAGRAINVGRPQLRRQKLIAAEDVERQVAIAIVIAVEETALLVAVQRIVGGIQIENDLLGRFPERFQEQFDEECFDPASFVADLVVACRFGLAQFQPVERRLARHRRTILATGAKLAGQNRHHRIVAQFVVVVEVLVAQRNPEHTLAHQRLTVCSINAGRRTSRKHCAKRPTNPIARSAAPSSRAPASDVIDPPSKPATTSRRPMAANANDSAVHSVGIGGLSVLRQIVLAKQFSQIPNPDALHSVRYPG